MNIQSECHTSENGRFDSSNEGQRQVFEQIESFEGMSTGNQHADLVEWLNGLLPDLNLPVDATEEELRLCLIDGSVLCSILNKRSPGSVEMGGSSGKRFLAAMDEMGLQSFELSDLEQGSMVSVLRCLRALKAQSDFDVEGENNRNHLRKRWNLSEVELSGETDRLHGDASTWGQDSFVLGGEREKNLIDSKFHHVVRSSVVSEPSSTLIHRAGHKFHEMSQLNQGCYADFSDATILEFMRSNSLDIAPMRTLFRIVARILDENTERNNGDVPQSVACLLRKLVQVIEWRISTQAENLKIQNNLFKDREEKYQSRLRALETLTTGTTAENEVVKNQLLQMKIEMAKIEEKKNLEEQDVHRLKKEKDHNEIEISRLKHKLEMTKLTHEKHCLQLEAQAKETKDGLEKKLKELERLLTDSGKKVKELEAFSESKSQGWNKKQCIFQSFMDFQFRALQELRTASESIKREVLKTKKNCFREVNYLGEKLQGLVDAAENYHVVVAENRKLYNEIQDLKGNIRVYCRIRPFLPGQNGKQTTIEYVGENGELIVVNPSKQGKDSRRLFKFNKVFGPVASQEEVFIDTQPLIRSVLDGYNVCIFAYGQTGSGKTYTMSGPNVSSEEDWGVNYRAINDLFQISQSRRGTVTYEVGVQMVEIYNEQVRDLLLTDGSQKRLGIWNTTQPNGLAVPDASMHPVQSTTDVLELMNIGLMNRAVGATALNERSSRSHSVLTVHVRGLDLETDSVLRGNLHLVDLAGSERVDRSEATGDRLREAQHINKSLSALGDVIFSLAQKSSHVPYRNSKLTQLLQSSLGGQAKTLMFVQLNPDVDSYSETISTLKFAERVSGVELGAARSNKEGRAVKELMEQLASLKDTIAKKDEKIEQLQLLCANDNLEGRGMSSLRYGSASPRRHSVGTSGQGRRFSAGKGAGLHEKVASDMDNRSENSDKHSETGSHQSVDEFGQQNEFFPQSKVDGGVVGQDCNEDIELLGFEDADYEERLSDISDGGLSMGTETDGSMNSIVELTLFPEVAKQVGNKEKPSTPTKLLKPPQKQAQMRPSRLSLTKGSSKILTSSKKPTAGNSSSIKQPTAGSSSIKPLRRWQ